MLTVLIGGARSGKSTLAVDWGIRHAGPVTFVATAPLLDDDMRDRAARHRAERPDWPTVEEAHDLAPIIDRASAESMVIVDCITLWVSNLMWRGDEETAITALAQDLADATRRSPARVVVVTNEVGSGVHPETELGRRYRDLLGRVNQILVAASDHSFLLVAGRAVALQPIADIAP
ncbi:MAG: bifunctional adenosylcobinamide kinase/adenosylcobinamide-phosphate guanylyltransferase [Actinomycetota bacterium]